MENRTVPVFSSFLSLTFAGILLFLINNVLPFFSQQSPFASNVSLILHAIVFLQLIAAWRDERGRMDYWIMFFLCALLYFRLIYIQSAGADCLWCYRPVYAHNVVLGIFWDITGTIGLHPKSMKFLQTQCARINNLPPIKKRLLLAAWFLFLAAVFILFRSHHITRDGMDWIQRTAQPVWHLYLREPLTIMLYRAVYLVVNPLFGVTPLKAIAWVSVATSLIGLFFYNKLLALSFQDSFDRLLGWLLAFACGGMVILFFGHIEVYPVFIAGIFAATYFAKRYMNGSTGIVPLTVLLAGVFTLHLSCGWLLPAFFLLPFIKKQEKPFRDAFTMVSLFFILLILCLGIVMVWRYNASPTALFARLHETFNVGLDRAMFLPAAYWFRAWHLLDLVTEYLYLAVALLMLLPLSVVTFIQQKKRENWFWLLLAAGYGVYTFTWNPDRGYPEDWDLFSPVVPLLLLFTIHPLLEHTARDGNEKFTDGQRAVYIVSMGIIPYALAQIWFHHTTAFVQF